MKKIPLGEGWSKHGGHYYVNGMSLCGAWSTFGIKDFRLGDDYDPDKCVGCKQELNGLKARLREQGVKIEGFGTVPSYSQLQQLASGIEKIRSRRALEHHA